MDSRAICLLSLIVVGFSIHIAYSIQCYQCNSYDDPGCADFFDNKTYVIHACPEDAKYCRKVVQQAYYEGEWHMRFIRQCAKEGELDATNPRQDWSCYDKLGTYRVKVKYCHCRVDGCNSAPTLSSKTILLGLPFLLAIFSHIDIRGLLPV
ncbi:UPAR/Ly6 domain-containing protein crok-like [Watersipora subatra]|uniref:UPAR/Ly6 domain-containing protein crok-like n=1 Tax=Watersipora subatra TaxID=2589382 RepID=UPI00355BA340